MWGSDEFAGQLLAAAGAVLPYIGAAVAAGVVLLAVIFGIRKGYWALRHFVNERRNMGWGDDWDDDNHLGYDEIADDLRAEGHL